MKRILIYAAIAVVVGVVLLGIVLAWRSSHGTSITLPDGSTVKLMGAAVGSAPFTLEKSWHGLARRILPSTLQKWIPNARFGSCSISSNSMTVYVQCVDPSGAVTTTKSWDFYGAEDDTGDRLQMEGGYCRLGSSLIGLTLRTWPRRQSSFRLNLLNAQGKVLGSLRVQNPGKRLFPDWTPQPLPRTQTNGPVMLTLSALRESQSDSLWRAVLAKSELHTTDPQWRAATVHYTTFYDATGNEGQWLPRTERAWKAELLVYRKSIDDFRPEERVVLQDIALSETGKFVTLDQTFVRAGVKIVLHVAAGAGRLHLTNGLQRGMSPPIRGQGGHSTTSDGRTTVESWGSDQPFLLFETQGQQNNDAIELVIRDEQGVELKTDSSSGYSSSASGRMYLRKFSPPPEAKSVSFEIAINRPLSFEFMVNPGDIEPATPKR